MSTHQHICHVLQCCVVLCKIWCEPNTFLTRPRYVWTSFYDCHHWGYRWQLTLRPRSTLSFITPMNSLWLRQLSPSMSKSLNTVSRTFSDSSWPVAIFTARLNSAAFQHKGKELSSTVCRFGRKWSVLTNREVLPIPAGRLASVTIFIEKAKSSRLLVNRQKDLNSSNVIL